MPQQDFEGRTAAEAAIKACETFGVPRSQLKYDILSDEGEGFERKVVIKASAPDVDTSSVPPDSDGDEDRPVGDRGSRHAGAERTEKPSRPERAGRFDRDRDRGGRRRGRRTAPREQASRRGDGGPNRRHSASRARRDDNSGIESLLDLEVIPTDRPPDRPEITGSFSDKAEKAKAVLHEIIRLAGFQVQPCVVQDDANEIHFSLRGEDEARVIGDKGEVLLSLQFLVNRLVGRETTEEQVIVMDAAGYRERRRIALSALAEKLAERAVDEGKVVRLSPMSAHDRRVFHLTLKEFDGVDTRSEGEGLFRNLLIIPSRFNAAGRH